MADIAVTSADTSKVPLLAGWMADLVRHMRTVSTDVYLAEAPVLPTASWAVRFMNAVTEPQQMLLVATLNGEPAGFLWARAMDPFIPDSKVGKVGRIDMCWVAEPARKNGVGRALVSHAESQFTRRGIRFIEANYLTDNTDAGEAWAALGFEPCRVLGRKAL